MSLQDKYSSVIALANALNIQGLNVSEDSGKLKLSGAVNTLYQKNKIVASEFLFSFFSALTGKY